MYNFRKPNGTKPYNAKAVEKTIMVSLALTLFLLLSPILPPDAEARTRGASGFGVYLILVNPAHVRYDTLFLPEATAPVTLPAGGSSYVAEMVVSAGMPPSAIILPDGVTIAAEKIRPRTPIRVAISGRIFDNRVEIPPKMEKVYSLRIDNPLTSSSGINKVEIIVLYE